jgi:hypothetical protein
MLKTINLIKEQSDPQYQNALNNDTSTHPAQPGEQSEDYNIDGSTIVIHSTTGNVDLSDEVRAAFEMVMNEFHQQVSDMVTFEPLNLYEDGRVQWSGKLTQFDMTFVYHVGKDGGTYLKGNMIKVDPEFITMANQLTKFYHTFQQKWASVQSAQKQNQPQNNANPSNPVDPAANQPQ